LTLLCVLAVVYIIKYTINIRLTVTCREKGSKKIKRVLIVESWLQATEPLHRHPAPPIQDVGRWLEALTKHKRRQRPLQRACPWQETVPSRSALSSARGSKLRVKLFGCSI